jgi:ABC-2 type transport system ATP-binding protein
MRNQTPTVLHIRELTKRFNKVVAVDGLSFSIARGEIVGILGANGAGKTTTLQMILGLIRPTSGRIESFGREHEQRRIEILRRMNFSSVGVNLPMNLTVSENLWIFAKLYGVKDAWRRLDGLLNLMEIHHLRDAITGSLSSGEVSRVNLCKALLNRPELLLLDEPTASLDPDIADKVRKILRRVQQEDGVAILYTSHNMRDIEEICDRVLFLHDGRLMTEGTPAQVIAQFRTHNLEEVFIRIARSGEVVNAGGQR